MRAETGSLSIAGTVTTDGTSSIFPRNPNSFDGLAAAWEGPMVVVEDDRLIR